MNNAERADVMGSFTFFPIDVSLEAGPRRVVVSHYAVIPAGGKCLWVDDRASHARLLRRLEMSFGFTRGVPPMLLMRFVRPLGRPAAWGDPIWTPQFTRFCTHYGCRPVFEARDRYWEGAVRDGILYRSYKSLDELEYVLGLWSDESPVPGLRDLPSTPFFTHQETFRRAAADGFILHDGNYYSVPQGYAGKGLWIRRQADSISLSTPDGDVIASHSPCSGCGQIVMDAAHFKPRARSSQRIRRVEQTFLKRFHGQQTFLSLLVAQQRMGAAAHLNSILRIANDFDDASWGEAFQHAIRYNNFSHRFIAGFLRQRKAPTPKSSVREVAVQGELF